MAMGMAMGLAMEAVPTLRPAGAGVEGHQHIKAPPKETTKGVYPVRQTVSC